MMIIRPVSVGQAFMVGEEYEEKALVVTLRGADKDYEVLYCQLHNAVTCEHTEFIRNQ